MVVTGSISNVVFPSKAVIGEDAKVNFHVRIDNTVWGQLTDNYQFLIDADTGEALKGNYISGSGDYERDEDITITMPDKPLFRFYLELWTEVPTKYDGVPVETVA